MDEMNLPLSEQYRIQAKKWVDANAAASLMERTRSAMLSQWMLSRGTTVVSRAEMEVKGSQEWYTYNEKMVEARKAENLLRVQLEYLRMRHSEQQSEEATKRAEMKL